MLRRLNYCYCIMREKVYIQHSSVHLIFSPHEVELSINTRIFPTTMKSSFKIFGILPIRTHCLLVKYLIFGAKIQILKHLVTNRRTFFLSYFKMRLFCNFQALCTRFINNFFKRGHFRLFSLRSKNDG